MTRINTPTAVLLGSLLIASAIFFRIDISKPFIGSVYAEVGGMSYSELRRDRDFKKAVKYIVENCDVRGGYIDDDYLYGASLSF
jgi:hypothetical protein